MDLFDILHQEAKEQPRKILWEDDPYGEYTFQAVEDATARIFHHLLDKGVGTEDMVLIRMRRSARIFNVMLGVWKAGAAFTVIGEHTPETMQNCITQENAPYVVFDDDSYRAAMECLPLWGHRKMQPHDLACIVYSSGSSGIFKGSMHEYGSVQVAVDSCLVCSDENKNIVNQREALSAGFYTMTSVNMMIYAIAFRELYVYVVPFDILEDDEAMVSMLHSKSITCHTASPNQILCLKKRMPPSLKILYSSYDIMCNLDLNGITFFNSYGLTESFGALISFVVDRKYDIVPVGKPYFPTKLKLLNEAGQPCGPGEIGEICFVNSYFRGYRNRAVLTSKAVRNGWIHSGDMAVINENDDYIILGRSIDIRLTPQGYVIPVQISVQFRKCFPEIQKSYVKLFDHGAKLKICLYYCGPAEYSIEVIRRTLGAHLFPHQLPTHSMRMEDFCYFPSGKINRLAFPELQ